MRNKKNTRETNMTKITEDHKIQKKFPRGWRSAL